MTTQQTKGPCRNCAGTGWVCENHRDYPWAGNTGGIECCGGAGAPCGVCNLEMAAAGNVAQPEAPTPSPELTARMVALVKRIAEDKHFSDTAEARLITGEARALVAELEPVDGRIREVAEWIVSTAGNGLISHDQRVDMVEEKIRALAEAGK